MHQKLKTENKKQNNLKNPFKDRVEDALDGEELHIVSDATTDNFNKITMHLLKWIGQIADYIINKKSFRFVVKYEPEAEIAKISFYKKKSKAGE